MSITIIDHIAPPAPKWIYQPVPLFKTTLEADRYWDNQYQRWAEGYAGLTGPHYFYLQECHLKDIYGDIIRPSWRDVDDFVYGEIDLCMKSGDAPLVYKRREVGMTSVFAGGLPFWFMRMYPGATINMTSKDQTGVHRMFTDKVWVTYKNMNPIILNPDPVNKNFTKQSLYLKIALKKRIETGELVIRESELNCMESSEKPDSPTNFSGSRGIYTYVDEGPLHKRIQTLLKSIDATRRKGTELKGFLAIAGTIEEKLQGAELAAFQSLIEDAEFLKLKAILIPAWMGLEQFSVNGWSDEKKGMDWIMRERERLDKAEDKSFLTAFKRNYPVSKADIFGMSQGGLFEQDVADTLNALKDKLYSERVQEPRYKFVDLLGSIEARPDSKGSFYMVEPPKPGIQYYQTIDGVASGTEYGGEKGSSVASIIFKGFDPAGGSYGPVCIYLERPRVVEDSYYAMINQFKFYNRFDGFKKAKAIYYETNAATGDHFGTFLRKAGLIEYAARRSDLSGKGYMDTKKLGQAVTEHVRDWQVRQANMFLRKYASNIRMKMLIVDLLNPEDKNSDMRDAFFMFMIAIPNFDAPVKKDNRPQYREIPILVNDPVRGMVYKMKKVKKETGPTVQNSNAMLSQYLDQMASKYGSSSYMAKMSDDERRIYTDLLSESRRHGNF